MSSLFLGFGLGDPETQIDEGLLLNIGRQRGKETAQCLRRGGRICPMLAGAAIVADLLSADDDLITLGSKAEEIIGAEAQKYTKRIRNHSTPQPNVTIAYNRDEGWSDCEAVHKTLDELNDPGEIGIEFTYIFTFEGRWIYFPTGEAELGFRDVKEDLDNDTVQYDSFFTEHENNMDWPDNGDFALDTDLRL